MKKLILTASILISGLLNAQTYPFYEDFDAMTTGAAPSGAWVTTGFQVLNGHGWSLPNACSANMKSTHITDTLTTPPIGPISGNTKISLSYRFVDAALYPNVGHTMTTGDKVTIDAFVGTNVFPAIATIDMTNHTAPLTTWTTYTYTNALFAFAGTNPCKMRIDVDWGSGDWYLDIDNFIIADVVTGISYNGFNPPSLAVAPNPSNGDFWVWIRDYKGTDPVKVTVYNSMGQIVKVVTPPVQYVNQVNVSTEGLARGVYEVEVSCKNEVSRTKVVIE